MRLGALHSFWLAQRAHRTSLHLPPENHVAVLDVSLCWCIPTCSQNYILAPVGKSLLVTEHALKTESVNTLRKPLRFKIINEQFKKEINRWDTWREFSLHGPGWVCHWCNKGKMWGPPQQACVFSENLLSIKICYCYELAKKSPVFPPGKNESNFLSLRYHRRIHLNDSGCVSLSQLLGEPP